MGVHWGGVIERWGNSGGSLAARGPYDPNDAQG